MRTHLIHAGIFLLGAAILVATNYEAVTATEVPTMTKEELRNVLENDDVVVLDVRKGRDWSASEFKIQKAVRAAPGDVNQWSDNFPKENTFVLYCA